ncbi:PIG-L family deacetylase [bacterium]|nr:MAG: PIG-L family deacetylase [bacterium]
MKVLAIGAHFDDVELGCGGTLLRHKRQGDKIYIIVVTNSGYKSKTKKSIRSAYKAKQEGKRSAEYLKAELICCNKDPIVLIPTEKLVLEIEEIVNKIKPDCVYTHQLNDSHADHATVGYVSMRACRKCDKVLMYRSNWYIMDNTQDDNYYVNISDFIDDKIRLLKFFESEMKNVNYSWLDFVKKQNSAAGAKVNVPYAETFHMVKSFIK